MGTGQYISPLLLCQAQKEHEHEGATTSPFSQTYTKLYEAMLYSSTYTVPTTIVSTIFTMFFWEGAGKRKIGHKR